VQTVFNTCTGCAHNKRHLRADTTAGRLAALLPRPCLDPLFVCMCVCVVCVFVCVSE